MSNEVVESTAVAIPTPSGQLVPDWWAKAYGPTCMYVTSLRADKPDERAALYAALTDESESSDDWLNKEMDIVHIVLVPAHKIVEGELQEWVRSVLILADGTRVSFGSLGIIKSLMLIQQLDRKPPWNPPLRKVLVNRSNDKVKRWYVLIDPPAAKPAKK